MWIYVAILLKMLVEVWCYVRALSDQWAKLSIKEEMICNANRLAICNKTIAPHLSYWKADLQNPESLCVPQKVTFDYEQVVLILSFSKAYVF